MAKRNNAIMIADTRPGLIGNLLVQLNETNKGLFDEAIIYYEEINEKDKEVMNKIIPCRFIKFNHKFPASISSMDSFKRFSKLMFSRYYMFDLLEEYETITWIDTDVLICGKLNSIIEKAKKTGMAANFEDKINKSYKYADYVKTSFKRPLHEYDMEKYNMSSGLIVVSKNLKNRKKMTSWCFEKTIEYAPYLILPDQGILNILIQEFKINVASVGEHGAYCFYPSYKRNSSKAKIIHAWGKRKFWNSWYLYNEYPDWKRYYSKWLSMGGSIFIEKIVPEVSIIIPLYKTNIKFLKLILVDLLYNQVQEHSFQYDNFEIILVSDDIVDKKLTKLIEKIGDKRLRLIFNESRIGISKSLNIGIKNSLGKYIARVDGDDRVHPSRIFKQVEYLNKNNKVNLVTSNFAYFGDMNEERLTFEKDMSKAWSIFTCPFDHPTIMFRKKFFIDNNLFYDEARKHVEDWELWLRAYKKGLNVGSIPEVLYFHRWYNGQAGQNKNTITMMRDLVKNNFLDFGILLDKYDLEIISPFNGKLNERDYLRIKEIFLKALEKNKKMKLYDQKSLSKVFNYRLFESKNGYINDVVINKNFNIKSIKKNSGKTFRQKLLSPFYKPFRRVFYNIISETISENYNIQNFEKIISENNKLLGKINSCVLKSKTIKSIKKEKKEIFINEELNLMKKTIENQNIEINKILDVLNKVSK